MKRKALSFFGLIMMFFICMQLLSTSVPAQQHLTFGGITGSNFLSEAGTAVLKEAYKNIGINIDVELLPAKRSLISSNNGEFDGEITRSENTKKTAPNLILIPVMVVKLDMCVFSKKPKFTVNGWNSLKPYKIGITRGIATLEKGTAGMDVDLSDGTEQLFKKLDSNRIDVVISNRLEGMLTIKRLKLSNIELMEPPVEVTKLYHYVHKKNAKLVPKITASLEKMEKNGRILEINKQVMDVFLKKAN